MWWLVTSCLRPLLISSPWPQLSGDCAVTARPGHGQIQEIRFTPAPAKRVAPFPKLSEKGISAPKTSCQTTASGTENACEDHP